MGNTWVTNMLHSLDDDGELAAPPGPARRLAEYMGSIVEAVTSRSPDDTNLWTIVICRRRPGHKPCRTNIVADYADGDPITIIWECPACHDNGYITGWQETLWDKRRLY